MRGLFRAHTEAPQKESCFKKLGKGAPLHAPNTHIHSLPKFLQPHWAASPPLLRNPLPVPKQNKTKTNHQQGRVPILYKVSCYSQHLGLTAHTTGFTYVHILTQWTSSCCVSVSWNPEKHSFPHTVKRQTILANDSRDLLPLSTQKTQD